MRLAVCLQIVNQLEGTFEIVGPTAEAIEQAQVIISSLTEDPEQGSVYTNVLVAGIEKFGLFVEFLPSQQGLVHVSELVRPLGAYSVGDAVDVKLLEVCHHLDERCHRNSRNACHCHAYTLTQHGVEREMPKRQNDCTGHLQTHLYVTCWHVPGACQIYEQIHGLQLRLPACKWGVCR